MFEDYILIQKIKNGDQNAWERVIEKYYHSIYFYCVRRCYGNVQLAADLTQDIFLKVIENIKNYRFTGKFHNYLFTIAVHHCNNHYKKKEIEKVEFNESVLSSHESDGMTNLVVNEENKVIQHALNQLSNSQREAIILRYYHDLKVKDIAKITGVGVPTAQSRIHQGLVKLSKFLDQEAFTYDEKNY